jgi:hypothetical protein
MDLFWEFLRHFFWQVNPLINWALKNWAITLVTLVLLIRWAGNARRGIKHY